MKLLFVTGIAKSNWFHIAESLQFNFKNVSKAVFSSILKINEGMLEGDIGSTAEIDKVIGSLSDKTPSILVEDNLVSSLDFWTSSPEVKCLVFYCSPQYALSNTLKHESLSREQCIKLLSQWRVQTKEAYNLFRKFRNQCLFLDVQDVVEHHKKAVKEISNFVEQKVKFTIPHITRSVDTELAAELILIEQDEAFELYDEIRSAAPLLGPIQLSAINDISTLANLSLDLIQSQQKERQKKQEEIEHLRKDLKEVGTKLQQQEDSYLLDSKNSTEKIHKLTEAVEKSKEAHKTEVAAKKKLRIDSDKKLSELRGEYDQLLTQKSQLTQELEATRTALKTTESDLANQITRLQLELDNHKQSDSKLRLQHKQEVESKSLELKNALTKNSELIADFKLCKNENDLLVLQTTKLQKEVENLYQTNQEMISEQHKLTAEVSKKRELTEKLSSMEADYDMAVLQIEQLQEELEYYYLQLLQRDSNKMQITPTIENLTQDVFVKCHIDNFDVVGSYDVGGYSDMSLILHGLTLADGRHFDIMPVKFFEVEGQPGLEFRPSDEEQISPPFRWREDMQDDYGSYIRFVPNPPESKIDEQEKTNQVLNASERLFILSIANALSDNLQQGRFNADNLEGKLRDWKLAGLRLKDYVASLPAWLSFDALTLIEEMRTDNYEHLWVSFDNLLVDNHLYPNFKIKFAALGPLNESPLFTETLMMEVREQDNEGAPLQAWPPLGKDEFGHKLQVKVDLLGDELVLTHEEKLSEHDLKFLRHLAKNFVNFIYFFEQQNTELERSFNDWLYVANQVNNLVKSKPKLEKEVENDSNEKVELEFLEYVDLNGYQHIVYKTQLVDGKELKLKLRAENINLSTHVADISIELRTGDESVPLADSVYYGEDDYGPRVLIGFNDLDSSHFNALTPSEGKHTVQAFMSEINSLIETNSSFTPEQKELWIGMLEKEQQ